MASRELGFETDSNGSILEHCIGSRQPHFEEQHGPRSASSLDGKTRVLAVLSMVFAAFSLGIAIFPSKDKAALVVLRVQPEFVDFNIVKQGAILDSEFQIENVSASDVRLIGIDSLCDCTTGRLGKAGLQPGDATEVAVRWDVGRARGKAKRELRVHYESNGRTGVQSIYLLAQVSPDYLIEPSSLILKSNDLQTLQWTVVLTPTEESGVELLNAYSTDPSLSIDDVHQESSRWIVKVSFAPTAWDGRDSIVYSDSSMPALMLETSSAAEPVFRIPVKRRVQQSK